MRKRVKKLNLNQSTKSHDKLLVKNLLTSLLTYGKVTTTKPRAKALKAFALSKVSAYKKLGSSLETKRWFAVEISTMKFQKRISEKLKAIAKDFAVTSVETQPRKGDNSKQYIVSIINFDAQKSNE
jgi:large subunit ribosomal protein L17